MRAQISLEFMIIMAAAVMGLLVLVAVGADQLAVAFNDKRLSTVNDIGFVIQQELVVASAVHDGYTRNFTLPETVQNKGYTISVANTTSVSVFTIHASGTVLSIRTPICNGTIQPGENIIRKQDNVLLCNP